jgi:hypothetical protein
VEIISPPHMVLASGMVGIQVGAMLLAVAAQNRASESDRRRLGVLYAASTGVMLGMAATFILENAGYANEMHASPFYILTAIVMPKFLLASARGSRLKWPATTAALIYMGIVVLMIWVLQIWPATPRLAPIYNPVDRMVPPPFPLLLVFPGLAIDLLLRRFGRTNDWLLAPVAGVLFVAVMLVTHWFWADFIVSPDRSPLLGADIWDYDSRVGPWRYEFWVNERGAALWRGLGWAALFATLSARVGLWWGKGMARVQR